MYIAFILTKSQDNSILLYQVVPSASNVLSLYRTSNAFLTQLPSEQNMSFPVPKRNQKQQFLLTGRERAGPTGSMLLEVYCNRLESDGLKFWAS